jgi:hypothetical protein
MKVFTWLGNFVLAVLAGSELNFKKRRFHDVGGVRQNPPDLANAQTIRKPFLA